MLTLVPIWAAMGLSWNILSGYSGLISFGHAAFFGLGAYTVTLMLVHWGVTPWIGIPATMLIGALAGKGGAERTVALPAGMRRPGRTPAIILATIFVSLPFVVREVEPVLHEIGTEQEQAASTLGASTWQTFWRITLPAIRWGPDAGR